MSERISNSPTVLVTGATDGIGYATARQLVDDGATVYLHARDQHSGEDAMTRLVKDGAEPLRLHLVVADFTRLDEVADLAEKLTATLPALDVLVNNAATAATRASHLLRGRPRGDLPGQLPRAVPADGETPVPDRKRARTSRQRVLGDAPRGEHQLEEPGWRASILAAGNLRTIQARAHDVHEIVGRYQRCVITALSVHPGVFDDPTVAHLRQSRPAGRRGGPDPDHAQFTLASSSRRWLLRRSRSRPGRSARRQRARPQPPDETHC